MEPMTSISEQLAAYKAGFKQRAAPERLAMVETDYRERVEPVDVLEAVRLSSIQAHG